MTNYRGINPNHIILGLSEFIQTISWRNTTNSSWISGKRQAPNFTIFEGSFGSGHTSRRVSTVCAFQFQFLDLTQIQSILRHLEFPLKYILSILSLSIKGFTTLSNSYTFKPIAWFLNNSFHSWAFVKCFQPKSFGTSVYNTES